MNQEHPTVEALTNRALAAIAVKAPNHFGLREVCELATLPDGKVASCTITVTAARFGKTNARTQYKLDGKVIAKTTLERTMSGTLGAIAPINEALRAEFEAHAPVLEREHRTYLDALWKSMEERNPGGVPYSPRYTSPDYYLMLATFVTLVDKVSTPGLRPYQPDPDAKAKLNPKRLARHCREFGLASALEWFEKTGVKLGEIESPQLLHDDGGELIVVGSREGIEIRMVQRCVTNQSPLGKLFNQYPARIYLDGSFITEAAYKERYRLDSFGQPRPNQRAAAEEDDAGIADEAQQSEEIPEFPRSI